MSCVYVTSYCDFILYVCCYFIVVVSQIQFSTQVDNKVILYFTLLYFTLLYFSQNPNLLNFSGFSLYFISSKRRTVLTTHTENNSRI